MSEVLLPPLPNTYWVIPGQLLAGEYPGGPAPDQARDCVRDLLEAGIDYFLNLTMPDELEPYHLGFPGSVEHVRAPILDHGVPAHHGHMAEILDSLQRALQSGRRVYVHCRAGIGRTGTVVGCLLVERGLTGEDALRELNRLWKSCARSQRWFYVPETDAQIAYVRNWQRQLPPGRSAAGASGERVMRARFEGALLGLAAGDALAAPSQGRVRGSFAPVTGLVGGGLFDLPAGAWSDDTAMALCIAASLLERDGFDPRDQVEHFARWQREGYLSATGQCVGITANTARAVSLARWRRQAFSGSHDPDQLDPEPLSRVPPVVMFFFSSPEEALELARDAARTTCQAPKVLEACQLFAAMLLEALSGADKAQVLAPRWDLDLSGPVRALAGGRYRGRAEAEIMAGSTILEVLEAVLWVFERTESFREGALLAANLGGDSDAVCAAYGALAGAYYGVDAIPADWRNTLIQKDLIERLAGRLLARGLRRPGR